ncbi:MAG: YceI family protein [Gemmatimonadota bacterium]|nr:YceI family protein [Gemmatimonadota bacterium]MDH5758967.1 YceI family protein [Gemmatimonadota bacterium]
MPRTTDGRLGRVGLLAWFLAAGSAGVSAQEYHVDREGENRVTFRSRASIEEFEGVTDRVDGYVLLDGERLTPETGGDDTGFYLEVDLASLDTGIGLRDRHMRDNYLEVRDHPYASYEGRIVATEVVGDGRFAVSSRGKLSIHGVTREVEVPCEVEARGEGYRARCDFQVLLSDHDIEIPSVMFLKLANEIRLEVEFTVLPATPER